LCFVPARSSTQERIKGLRENRIAVRFEYEWHDRTGQWYRSYGNEMWEFANSGLMHKRFASINDISIREQDRRIL
jgi:nuclear transport factor 2 (NTF2) superfamily protein